MNAFFVGEKNVGHRATDVLENKRDKNPATTKMYRFKIGASTMPLRKGKQWDKKILDQIWEEKLFLCYKPLLLLAMCDTCDAEGRSNLRTLAEYFSRFFQARRDSGKIEDNPKAFRSGSMPSDRSLSEWESEIRREPLRRISKALLTDEGSTARWANHKWPDWSQGFKKALRNTAETRLIEYFDSRVAGGY